MTLNRDGGVSVSTDSQVSERDELLEALRDKNRRHHLASVVTKRGLAEQIREMRLARGWTQTDLAHATNKVQETISQLENPNYGNYTLKTLQRLAEAFDVTLTVRFDPFSELVRRLTELTPEDLAVPDYEHDPDLHVTGTTSTTETTAEATPPIQKEDTGRRLMFLSQRQGSTRGQWQRSRSTANNMQDIETETTEMVKYG